VSAQAPPESAVQSVVAFADDELILGWRDSEWTGVAPFLEEDVAFSSIAQGEIGHARALYELAAGVLGGDADALAFDRDPADYRCAPFVELQLVGDWAATIARHWLYETADSIRVADLATSDWPELAGLAAKMDREEAYHRMHAQMWAERLRSSAESTRFEEAVAELWPYALGLLAPGQRERLAELVGRALVEPVERGAHADGFAALHEEMTMVRRSVPGAAW
jgi:ring-1,2-phenylacetyl-CoA epoxidase subunit PaaC